MLIARRIIFSVFLLAYLVICPLLLLYASGYIVDPFTREVRQTGLVRLASSPSGARIYLEKSRFVRTTPATIDKLVPGQYKVTLTRPGYRSWVHTIDIKPGKAAVFEHIVLIPEVLSQEAVLPGTFEKLIPLEGTDHFLLAKDPSLKGLELYNWKNGKSIIISDKDPSPVLAVFHEPDSRAFVLHVGSLRERKYLYVELKNDEVTLSDITKLFTQDPLLIQWDQEDPGVLFAVYADHVDRLDVFSAAVYPKYVQDVKGSGFKHNKMFFMTDDNAFIRYSLDKTKVDPFLDDVHFDPDVISKNVFYHITFPKDGYVLLLGEDGRLLTNYLPYQIAEHGVVGTQFNARSDELLFWSKEALGTASFLNDEESRIKSLDIQNVHQGKDIKQCFWGADTEHVLCLDNDKVFFLEIESEGREHEEFIASVRKGTEVFLNSDQGDVYFINESGALRKTRIGAK